MYGTRLEAGEPHYMPMFRVGATPTDVRVLDDAFNDMLHMRFESLGRGGSSAGGAAPVGPDAVDCCLVDLRAFS